MGISGLLPALKSIQIQKHLSELAGQTVAVDAYVWLHKGIFTCATELATGKPTSRYVHYAMERVRLLRHHKIEPYIVFDGGPLPAKKATEVSRKQKREENLARGHELAANGKHSQAREYYTKCVDVTPQMAFQFIKALKAESVQYVVAPYEADAQLAYLERMGIVDSVLTEDSDLLVFGCQNVLLKLDTAASTVISISRDNFGSVTCSSTESNSISLLGWSDKEFRSMAILSGCDYLPSIPGIGLKTANSLLRRWRTAEQAVRVLSLEGKKNVPRGYMAKFRMAEKCFMHQRVYDPLTGKLVHLTEVDDSEWDEETKAYVGSDIEPSLAKQIAEGDVDPVTRLPMNDINPGFAPRNRVLRDLPIASKLSNHKGKAKEGILSFFGPNATIPPRTKSPLSKPMKPKVSTGKASGKRTLAEVMEHDVASKKKRHDNPVASAQSRFFGGSIHSNESPVAGPSCVPTSEVHEKENVIVYEVLDDEEDLDSMLAQGHVDSDVVELGAEEPSPVEQEDGYTTPSHWTDAGILSSPVHHQNHSKEMGDEFDVDAISSPPSGSRVARRVTTPIAHRHNTDTILVQATPAPHKSSKPKPLLFGPDLRDAFGDEVTSDIEEDGVIATSPVAPRSSPIPSPLATTPKHTASEGEEPSDPEEVATKAFVTRREVVAAGWREKWALGSAVSLQRRETNIMHGARYRQVPLTHSRSHPYLSVRTPTVSQRRTSSGFKVEVVTERKSLGCLEDELLTDGENGQSDTTAAERAQERFQRFSRVQN